MRKTQASSKNVPAIIESGARQSLFLLLLSISLVLASIPNILIVLDKYDSLQPFLILYGIAAILASVIFILQKEIPRNIGFVTLAIFLLLDGINVERLAFNSDYPLYFFALNGITALVSGIFFASRRETWKNFGFIMLSGYLISTAAASMTVYTTNLNHAFLFISAIFALPAVISFFLRK